MKHWRIDEVDWGRFDRSRAAPAVVPLVKAAAMVERNGSDYAAYLKSVFSDDPDFCRAADNWAVEEVQHGEALGRWATLADPGWDFHGAFERYREGFRIQLDADRSVRGSRTGELIARCIVESGTSSYYSALGDAAEEPVLREVCRLIAADEYRHFKLFYDHMRRYLVRERLGFLRRLRIAAGRVGETEDDELAFAYHCSNQGPDTAYDHADAIAQYMASAMGFYRRRHVERGMVMIHKAIGLPPHGRLATVSTGLAWRLVQRRQRRFALKVGVALDLRLPA